LCLRRRLSLPTYTIDEINKQMNVFILANGNLEKYIEGLLIIFNSIYNYHQNKLEKYYKELESTAGYFMKLKTFFVSHEKTYFDSYDVKEFTLANIESSKQNFIPKYETTGNKLLDEIKYVERLINFVIPTHIIDPDFFIL
jgi:hypothetical protein